MDPEYFSHLGNADALQLACNVCMLGFLDSDAEATRQAKMRKRQGVSCGKIITEYVRVPSSDHVAVVIGKGGRRLRSIQDRTNTYILAAARGQVPTFTITGRENDVKYAKMQIILASDLFTIRLSAYVPGHITQFLHVPRCAVSTLVGPFGTRLCCLQRQTLTHILAPPPGHEPVFTVTGQPWRVAVACNIISAYITGMVSADDGDSQ